MILSFDDHTFFTNCWYVAKIDGKMSEKHSRLDKTQITCTCKCNNQIHETHLSLHNTVKRIFSYTENLSLNK